VPRSFVLSARLFKKFKARIYRVRPMVCSKCGLPLVVGDVVIGHESSRKHVPMPYHYHLSCFEATFFDPHTRRLEPGLQVVAARVHGWT